MMRSNSNLQTIVLTSVLSATLPFGVLLSLYGYHTQIADTKKSHQHHGSSSKDTTSDNTPDAVNYPPNTEIINVV
jgi:hypothetical protein